MAEAEAPARPAPTTITLYFRLFAGLTSFMSKRWRDQRVSIGPLGAFETPPFDAATVALAQQLVFLYFSPRSCAAFN